MSENNEKQDETISASEDFSKLKIYTKTGDQGK
jgi:hypothetical protein